MPVSQSFLDQRKKIYGGQTTSKNKSSVVTSNNNKVSSSFLEMRQKVYTSPAPKPIFTQPDPSRVATTATTQKPKQKYSFWEEVKRFGSQLKDASKDVVPNLKLGAANFMKTVNKQAEERYKKLEIEYRKEEEKLKKQGKKPKYDLETYISMRDMSYSNKGLRDFYDKKGKEWTESSYKDLTKNQQERTKKFGVREGAGGIADDIATSAPSMIASIGTALVAGIATRRPDVAVALGFSTSYAQGSSEIYKQARDFGVDDKRATEYAHNGGIAMGALDTIPIGRLINKLPAGNAIKKKIQSNILKQMMSVGIQGTLESGTEVSQTILQNAIAQTYNEDQKLFEGIDRTAISAFILGAGADVTTSGVAKVAEKVTKQPKTSEEALQQATQKISEIINKEKRTPKEEEIYQAVVQSAERESLFGEESGEQLVTTASKYKDAETFAQEVFGTTKKARVGFLPDTEIRIQAKINPLQVQQYLNEVSRDQEIEPVEVFKDGEQFITNGEDYKIAAFRILKKPVPVIVIDDKADVSGRFKTIEELFAVVKERQKGREDFNVRAGLNPDGTEIGSDRQQFDENDEALSQVFRSKIRRPKEYKSDLEREAFDEVEKTPTKFANAYLKKSRTDNYINSDDILPLLGDRYKGHNEAELRRVAASVRDMVFDTWLEERQGTKNNTVMLVAAGPGSGKTTYFQKAKELGDDSPVDLTEYPIVLETLLNGSNAKKISKSTEYGYKVQVLFILRHPLDAWKEGVLPRVKEEGRTVEETAHINAHKGELEQIQKLYEKYKDNEDIEFHFVDNTGSEAKETTIDFIKQFSYNADEVLEQMRLETDKVYENEGLTKEQYEATTRSRENSRSEGSRSAESGSERQEKESITAELPQNPRREAYDEAFSAVMDAVIAGDMDAAIALRQSFLEEDKIKLPEIDEMSQMLSDQSAEMMEEVTQELKDAVANDNPDDPTNRLLSIADKLDQHFRKPGKQQEVSGEPRTIQDGTDKLVIGPDMTALLDRLVFGADIDSFGKNIRLMHLKYNDTFTDIYDSIRTGGIDGADYEQFKKQFQQYRETKGRGVGTRGRVSVKTVTTEEKSETTKTSDKNVSTSKVTKKTSSQNYTQELVAALRKQIGNEFEYVEPVNTLWKSKGNTLYIRPIRHRANSGFADYMRKYSFVESVQEAGGNNVYKVIIKKDSILAENSSKTAELTTFKLSPEQEKNIKKRGILSYEEEHQVEKAQHKPSLRPHLIGEGDLSKYKKGQTVEFNYKKYTLIDAIKGRNLLYETEFRVKDAQGKSKVIKGIHQEIEVSIVKDDPAFTGGGKGAAKGEFAELPNMTKDEARERGTIPEVEPTFTPFPEIVRLVKEITGKYPVVKKKMGMRLGDAQPGTLRVRLRADIFENVDKAAKTLSHELGHIIDFMPDGAARKGNLLSRIASLNNFLKHTLKEFPDSTLGELTKKDRENIRKRAKELSKQKILVTEEVVVGEKPVSAEEIKAIWNDVMSVWNDTELLTYVKSLDDKQKAQLVKAAMRGTVPEWVSFKRQVKETITHEVIKNAPEDIKKLYQKMLKEEILARRLFELNVIKEELYTLSKKWRPFSEKWSDQSYIKYRKSSEELYADAISVLFNDPKRLRTEAPEFWRGFFNYIDQKPEVKSNVFAIWDTLNQSEEVKLQKRLDDIYEGFAEAKEKRKAIELEKPLQRKFLEKFMKQHVTVFDPIYRKLKPKFKEHGLELSPAIETRMQLEEMQMRRNESYLYLDKINKEVITPIETIGLTEDDLGVLLQLERNLGDRKDIANPYGLQGEYADETLNYFRDSLMKNRNITEEQFNILQQAARKFREIMFSKVEQATKYQLYSKEFFENTALPNKDTYVTYQVVEYIHDNYVSAGIKQAVGTLKEVENPVVSSLLKTLAVIEQTEIQKGKLKIVSQLQQDFAEDISEAEAIKPKGVRVGWKPVKDRDVLEVFVDGKIRGYNVDPYIKEMFDLYTGTELHSIARVSGKFNQVFKPIVTTYNLSWGFFSNISRDSRRTYKNLTTILPKVGKGKNVSLAEFITTWVTSVPEGVRFQRGKITPKLEEMLQAKAFTTPFTSFDPTANEESSLAPILRRYNFLPDLDASDPQWKKTLKKYTTPIRLVLRGIEFAGSSLETTSKIAGYQMVKKRVENAQFAGYIVRNYVGTPNFMDGGSQKRVDNNVFVFSNVMIQAVRSDLELATNPQTRAGYFFRTLMIDILPKIAMLAVAAGLLGDELKEQMDKATEYDKTNFLVIPFGTRENGKANYFRIPQDETGRLLSAMVWKVGQFLNGDLRKPEQLLSLGAGYIPSVTPLWNIAEGWLNYAQGRNPYDDYRGRLVIDDTTWKAGGLPVFQKMVQWTTNEAGLSQFSTYTDETDTTLDIFLKSTPILNRMVKSTDYGLKEKEQILENKIDQQKAQQTLKEREVLKEYAEKGKKVMNDEEAYNAVRKEFYHSIIGQPPYDSDEKAKRTRLKAKFDVAVLRGEVSREMDQLIDADTNDYKVELLREWKKTMSEDEYTDLIKMGREKKIISDELKKKLKKEDLFYKVQ